MRALLVPVAMVLSAGSVVLFAIFFLWNPVSERIRTRVDTLLTEGRQGQEVLEGVFAPSTSMRFFKRLFMLGMPRKWGVNIRPLTLFLVGLVAGGFGWLLSRPVAGLPLVASLPLAAIAFWSVPNILARQRQSAADDRFVELFPEAIDMIVRVLRAGLPVTRAIRVVAQEAPAPINEVFASMADRVDIGMSFEDALAIASERIGLSDFGFFAAAVALQSATGGNIISTLEILADIIHRRHAVKMKARAATAEVRMSAYLLSSLPFIIFGLLAVVSPGYMAPLVADPRGNAILLLAGIMLLFAFLSMRYMMRSVARP